MVSCAPHKDQNREAAGDFATPRPTPRQLQLVRFPNQLLLSPPGDVHDRTNHCHVDPVRRCSLFAERCGYRRHRQAPGDAAQRSFDPPRTHSHDVELVEPAQTAGYYHVRSSEGDEGWVRARSLEIVPAQSGSTVPPSHPGSGGQPASPPAATTGMASSISPSWDKPDPNQTTFHGPDGDCGPTGDGGDTFTNARKNRTDEPAQYHDVTWKAVQGLPYPVAGRSLANWTGQQLAEIQPYEGVAVSVPFVFASQ